MVASGVLERNAGEKAAPKKMARSRSTRRDARTATRRVASEPAPRPRRGESGRTHASGPWSAATIRAVCFFMLFSSTAISLESDSWIPEDFTLPWTFQRFQACR